MGAPRLDRLCLQPRDLPGFEPALSSWLIAEGPLASWESELIRDADAPGATGRCVVTIQLHACADETQAVSHRAHVVESWRPLEARFEAPREGRCAHRLSRAQGDRGGWSRTSVIGRSGRMVVERRAIRVGCIVADLDVVVHGSGSARSLLREVVDAQRRKLATPTARRLVRPSPPRKVPRGTLSPQVRPILHALVLSQDLHRLRKPATRSDLAMAEQALGRRLPRALRDLLRFSNGAELAGGNLWIDGTKGHGGMPGLGRLTARERTSRPWIPDDVVVFGGNGADSLFGIWWPRGAERGDAAPVVELLDIFEPRSLAIAGSDLVRFLHGWLAYYLLLEEASPAALDALAVPVELWNGAFDHAHFARIRAWADPRLGAVPEDPHRQPFDTDGVRRRLAEIRAGHRPGR